MTRLKFDGTNGIRCWSLSQWPSRWNFAPRQGVKGVKGVQNSTGRHLRHLLRHLRHLPRQPVMEALWQGDVGSHRASAWKVTDPALQSYDSYATYVILCHPMLYVQTFGHIAG